MSSCTGWFDGSWGHCCQIHDQAYAIGGDFSDKLASDIALLSCVSKENWLIAIVMFFGVSLFGYIFWRKNDRLRKSKRGD